MLTLDPNIYGSDTNSVAQAVSADALDVQTPGAAIANYWDAAVIDQDARSKGNDAHAKNPVASLGDVVVKSKGEGSDSRARTAGNHGKQG